MVILYFIYSFLPTYSTFISLDPDSLLPRVCMLFLVPLGKSGSPQRKRRHSGFFIREAHRSSEGLVESKNHNQGSRDPRGSPDLPRRDLRISMQIPAVAPWGEGERTEGGRKAERLATHERTNEARRERRDERKTNWFPPSSFGC